MSSEPAVKKQKSTASSNGTHASNNEPVQVTCPSHHAYDMQAHQACPQCAAANPLASSNTITAAAKNTTLSVPPSTASSTTPISSATSPSSVIGMKDDMLDLQLIKQGAEGRLYSCTFLGRPCIMKERFRKAYRHPLLDQKLSSARMTQEVRCMIKARKQPPMQDKDKKHGGNNNQHETIYTPTIYYVDEEQQRIYMERIEGITVKDRLYQLQLDKPEDELIGLELAAKIGRGISDIHSAGLLHGDLTTSNLMLVPTKDDPLGQLVAIDFGLASVCDKAEERAVDLYVLERAFLSTHPNSEKMVGMSFESILNTYRNTFSHASQVMGKLVQVRQRGRKREMVG